MNFMISSYTDVGLRKKTNQDSLLIEVADSNNGKIAFGVVCDGMGGFAKGELASATLIKGFKEWFDNRFTDLVAEGFSEAGLRRDWTQIIQTQNDLIQNYGRKNGIRLGTTLSGVLIYNNKYFIVNVGDSRIYQILPDALRQITKDHTFIQREIDAGRMTYEQSLKDPYRSVLLQCIGASHIVNPVFNQGQFEPGTVFMLCCDGFRHVVLPEELYQAFRPDLMKSTEIMKNRIADMIKLNIRRNEEDNISAILVKTY